VIKQESQTRVDCEKNRQAKDLYRGKRKQSEERVRETWVIKPLEARGIVQRSE